MEMTRRGFFGWLAATAGAIVVARTVADPGPEGWITAEMIEDCPMDAQSLLRVKYRYSYSADAWLGVFGTSA